MQKTAVFILIASAVFAFHCVSNNSEIPPVDGEPSSCTSCNKPTLVVLNDQSLPTSKVTPGSPNLCSTVEFSLASLKTATVQAAEPHFIQISYGVNPNWENMGPVANNLAKIDGSHEPRIRGSVTINGGTCPNVHLTIVGYAWD